MNKGRVFIPKDKVIGLPFKILLNTARKNKVMLFGLMFIFARLMWNSVKQELWCPSSPRRN